MFSTSAFTSPPLGSPASSARHHFNTSSIRPSTTYNTPPHRFALHRPHDLISALLPIADLSRVLHLLGILKVLLVDEGEVDIGGFCSQCTVPPQLRRLMRCCSNLYLRCTLAFVDICDSCPRSPDATECRCAFSSLLFSSLLFSSLLLQELSSHLRLFVHLFECSLSLCDSPCVEIHSCLPCQGPLDTFLMFLMTFIVRWVCRLPSQNHRGTIKATCRVTMNFDVCKQHVASSRCSTAAVRSTTIFTDEDPAPSSSISGASSLHPKRLAMVVSSSLHHAKLHPRPCHCQLMMTNKGQLSHANSKSTANIFSNCRQTKPSFSTKCARGVLHLSQFTATYLCRIASLPNLMLLMSCGVPRGCQLSHGLSSLMCVPVRCRADMRFVRHCPSIWLTAISTSSLATVIISGDPCITISTSAQACSRV